MYPKELINLLTDRSKTGCSGLILDAGSVSHCSLRSFSFSISLSLYIMYVRHILQYIYNIYNIYIYNIYMLYVCAYICVLQRSCMHKSRPTGAFGFKRWAQLPLANPRWLMIFLWQDMNLQIGTPITIPSFGGSQPPHRQRRTSRTPTGAEISCPRSKFSWAFICDLLALVWPLV